jgi:hypothetical protein
MIPPAAPWMLGAVPVGKVRRFCGDSNYLRVVYCRAGGAVKERNAAATEIQNISRKDAKAAKVGAENVFSTKGRNLS